MRILFLGWGCDSKYKRGGWKFFNGPMHRVAIEGRKKQKHTHLPRCISGRCFPREEKPKSVVIVSNLYFSFLLTMKIDWPRRIHIYACRWIHFFKWSSHVYRVAIFQRKRWKETILFFVSRVSLSMDATSMSTIMH